MTTHVNAAYRFGNSATETVIYRTERGIQLR